MNSSYRCLKEFIPSREGRSLEAHCFKKLGWVVDKKNKTMKTRLQSNEEDSNTDDDKQKN